ncbi:MAG: threonine--tRNA ligase [Patescibacteria group bacterium]
MSDEQLHKIRHSLAHLLASVVMQQDPDAKLGVGPVIENGFYYDIQTTKPISDNQLLALENKIRALIKKNLPFEQKTISVGEARKTFAGQPFKLELISDIEQKGTTSVDESLKQSGKDTVSVYTTGNFADLCQGPHVKSTKEIPADAFKLTKLAGAYWRGSEKNPMLTRVYGVAFHTKKELDEYVKLQEELEKRDHRKLGSQLGLFTFSPLVGAGLPLFTPKGTLLRNLIADKIQHLQEPYGFQRVWIPHIAKRELYETSGHWEKFREDLFHVKGKASAEFVMKPMNCPHHTQIYASVPRSYRDLPVRYAEVTTNYRDEQPGELLGLSRVRSLTQDDGHIFCTPEQVGKEISNIVKVIRQFYTLLRLFGKNDYWVSLSVRDGKTPEKYIGDPAQWEHAEQALEKAAKAEKLAYKRVEGEAAFYGPKLDFMFKDAVGREWQLATIQLDFAMPERFGLTYKDSSNTDRTPVMIHRAVAGSLERFLSVLIEHFAGAFPLWLAPVQIIVMSIGKGHKKYAKEVYKTLKAEGLRVELRDDDETIGKKIRAGEQQKIPYMLIVGDKEVKSKSVAVRTKGKDKGAVKLKKLLAQLKKEVEKKK